MGSFYFVAHIALVTITFHYRRIGLQGLGEPRFHAGADRHAEGYQEEAKDPVEDLVSRIDPRT